MQECVVNILGSEWEIKIGNENEYPNLKRVDGYSDVSVRRIVLDDMKSAEGEIDSKADLENHQKSVLRHEIIHAFMYESGLDANASPCEAWAVNEEMIDWFAIQSVKIFKTFRELDLL